MPPSKPIYAYLSAAALAAVTIFTFAVFQDYGPRSTIRRFHSAVVERRFDEIPGLTVEGPNAPAVRYMINFVARLATGNPTYEIVEMKRVGPEVQAAVEYSFPNGMGGAVLWHVRQTNVDWRIDCGATAQGILNQ